ncbi:Uncharacterised protein [Mycobacteroides abscessus subsp. massiliense]|nr:Uncharacterised protein [Mycobacteroides abscessus subsp. massiliense]
MDRVVWKVSQDGHSGRDDSERKTGALVQHVRSDWEIAILAEQYDGVISAAQ